MRDELPPLVAFVAGTVSLSVPSLAGRAAGLTLVSLAAVLAVAVASDWLVRLFETAS